MLLCNTCLVSNVVIWKRLWGLSIYYRSTGAFGFGFRGCIGPMVSCRKIWGTLKTPETHTHTHTDRDVNVCMYVYIYIYT